MRDVYNVNKETHMPLIPNNNLSINKKLKAARKQLQLNEQELRVTHNRKKQAQLKRTIKFLRRRIRKLETLGEPVTELPTDSFFSQWWHDNAQR